jgi:hypothetical protein
VSDQSPPEQGFWAEEFDLAALTYQQFLEFFFDRPVVGDEKEYELFRGGIDYFVASNPATVVGHLHRMCAGFTELTKVHSTEQIEQGLWAVFGAEISCQRFLFDPTVDPEERIACIESMYLPFRDVVATSTLGKKDAFYWMWWDMILHADHFFSFQNYEDATEDTRQMLDAIYESLLKILALDHPACQWSALHGLGHLPHPGVKGAVDRYLAHHRGDLSAEDAEWVERCGRGKIA